MTIKPTQTHASRANDSNVGAIGVRCGTSQGARLVMRPQPKRRPMVDLVAVGLVALSTLFAFNKSATAQIPVSDLVTHGLLTPIVGSTSATAASTAATASSLATLNGYLMGVAGGNGAIELLGAMNEKIGKIEGILEEMPNTEAALDQARALQWANREVAQRRTASAARAGCAEVSLSMGRGGGGSTTQSAARGVWHRVVERMTANRRNHTISALAELVEERSPYCSQEDVDQDRPGCAGGAAGEMPSADITSSSLVLGAVATPQTPTNRSLTPEQQDAADAFINNLLPQPLPQPLEGEEKTQLNNIYLVYFNKYNARWSAIQEAMGSIRAINTASEDALSASGFAETWNSGEVQESYERVFPNQVFPREPSEMEMLYYDVFRNFADPKVIAARESMGDKELLLDIVRLEALNARLALLQVQRLEENNKLLSSLLAQSLDPLTRDDMAETLTSGVSGQGGGGN